LASEQRADIEQHPTKAKSSSSLTSTQMPQGKAKVGFLRQNSVAACHHHCLCSLSVLLAKPE
jgi:hypothetical protein